MRDFLYLYAVVASIGALIPITYTGVTPTFGEWEAADRAIDPTVASSSSSFRVHSELPRNHVNGKDPKHSPTTAEGTASSPTAKIVPQPKKVEAQTELQLSQETAVFIPRTKAEEEEQRRRHLMEITVPWANVTTVGYWSRGFWSGFRNQMMAFSSFGKFSDCTVYFRFHVTSGRPNKK